MEVIAQKISRQNLNIKTILTERLAYFSNQGLQSSLSYLARTTTLCELDIHNINFNRILFNTLSFLLESQDPKRPLQISVKNNSKFLKITFSQGRIDSRLPSLKNGFSLLSSRRKPQSSFLAVQNLVRESGGSFSLISLSPCNPIYCLQIPLSPLPSFDNSSPPPRQSTSHRLKSKGALFEGVFFNLCCDRLVAL